MARVFTAMERMRHIKLMKSIIEKTWEKGKKLNPKGTPEQFAKDFADTVELVGETINELETASKNA